MRKISLIVGVVVVTVAIVCAYAFSQPADISNPDASSYGKESIKKSAQRSRQAEEAGAQMVLSGPVTLFPKADEGAGTVSEGGLDEKTSQVAAGEEDAEPGQPAE